MRPHRQKPTRLPCPWDSPGKNAGVGCHFLLQCMTVKSESEVVQLCLTLSDPPTRLLRPWGFPSKSTGVGCCCLPLNGHESEQILRDSEGQGGLTMGSQRARLDWVTEQQQRPSWKFRLKSGIIHARRKSHIAPRVHFAQIYLGNGLNSTHCHKLAIHRGELRSGQWDYLYKMKIHRAASSPTIHPDLGSSRRSWAPAVHWCCDCWCPNLQGAIWNKSSTPVHWKVTRLPCMGELQTWKFSARKTCLTKAQTRHLAPTLCDAGLPDWQENHSKELIMLLEHIPWAVQGYFYFTIRYNMFHDAPCPGHFLKIVFAESLIPVNHQLSKIWIN